MRRLAATALVPLLLAGTAAATIKPARGMSGISLGMTPAQVQAKLGRPGGRVGSKWHYPRVSVGFRARRVVELSTRRSTERLANGLGVDSTEAQVRAAYPQLKCTTIVGVFKRCRLGSGAPGSRVTDFTIGSLRRVIQITITQLP